MEVAPNVFKIRFPLPFEFDHVNCYLLRGSYGWSIIDTGLKYLTSNVVWEDVFKSYGLKFSDIEGIYISHYHPDHYGASGWLQELTGAPVYMHRAESASVDQVWKKGRSNIPVVGELFKENGVPPNLIAVVLDEMATFWNNIQTHPTLSLLSGGEKVDLGNKVLKVIDIPGHSEGHIGFFCEDDGLLFSGDQFLPKISSNTGFWPASNPNPLGLYMKSLEKVAGLPVKTILPAHGSVIYDCPGRVRLLMEHCRYGLDRIADLAGAGSTAYKICVQIFGNVETFSGICFSLTETLAYLAYLESSSRVISRQEAGIVVYRRF